MLDKLKCLIGHQWVDLGLVKQCGDYSDTISRARICYRCDYVDLTPIAEVKPNTYPDVPNLTDRLMEYYKEV